MESLSQSGLWVRDEGAYPQRWESWDKLRVGHRCSVMDRTGYFTRFTLPYLTLPHVKFSDKASDVPDKLGVFPSLTGMTRRSRMRRRNDSSLRLQASSCGRLLTLSYWPVTTLSTYPSLWMHMPSNTPGSVLASCVVSTTLIGSLIILGFSASIVAHDHSSSIGITHLVVVSSIRLESLGNKHPAPSL